MTVNLYKSRVATCRDRKDEALVISVFAVATGRDPTSDTVTFEIRQHPLLIMTSHSGISSA